MIRIISLLLSLAAAMALQPAYAIPDIEHWSTDKGARVYFASAPGLPMVDIEVTFAAGSAWDGDKNALATLTASLLEEGTTQRDSNAIAEQFAILGSRFSHSVDREMVTFHLRSLTEAELLNPAVDLLAELLSQPSFPEPAIARIRQQMLAMLKYQQQQPSEIARQAFYQAVFGQHPYAMPVEGTAVNVQTLTQADIKTFHQRYYVAANAQVAIVGAISQAQASELANRLTAQLATGTAAPPLPPVPALVDKQRIHIPHASSQTHILLGQPGMTRHDAAYFDLFVGNEVLGGSMFVSRLNQSVREDRGLAYSISSLISARSRKGIFVASAQTRNAEADTALSVMLTEIEQFIETGPTPEQLDRIKRNLTGGFPLRIDSNNKIVSYLTVIGFYGMPLDHLQKFNKRVEAVTVESIQTAFRDHIQPTRFVIVTVGDNTDSGIESVGN